MMREYHVRFCEQLWVKFLGLTRPYLKSLLLNGAKHRLMRSVIPSPSLRWDKLRLGSSIKQFLLVVFYAFMRQLELNLLVYFNLNLNVHFNNYNGNFCPGSQHSLG